MFLHWCFLVSSGCANTTSTQGLPENVKRESCTRPLPGFPPRLRVQSFCAPPLPWGLCVGRVCRFQLVGRTPYGSFLCVLEVLRLASRSSPKPLRSSSMRSSPSLVSWARSVGGGGRPFRIRAPRSFDHSSSFPSCVRGDVFLVSVRYLEGYLGVVGRVTVTRISWVTGTLGR
jgi:hypothetical protein